MKGGRGEMEGRRKSLEMQGGRECGHGGKNGEMERRDGGML